MGFISRRTTLTTFTECHGCDVRHSGALNEVQGAVAEPVWWSRRVTRGEAPVAQRIEHLTTDQKVRGSNPFGRAPS